MVWNLQNIPLNWTFRGQPGPQTAGFQAATALQRQKHKRQSLYVRQNVSVKAVIHFFLLSLSLSPSQLVVRHASVSANFEFCVRKSRGDPHIPQFMTTFLSRSILYFFAIKSGATPPILWLSEVYDHPRSDSLSEVNLNPRSGNPRAGSLRGISKKIK